MNQDFERLYVCLQACKEGFKAGCRPVVGVDGCHLKGPHSGVLLAAIGIDANNCMFHVAYAVVEGETKKSWTWFFQSVQQDLGIYDQPMWTFISDKQKGLLPAFEDVFLNVHHRFYVIHLHSNFKFAGYKSKAHKDMLWKAAQACNVPHFEAAMLEMYEKDKKAYESFNDKPPVNWSKSNFLTLPKCDMLVNNICENFNKYILDPRTKPILGLLEGFRNYIMGRMQDYIEKMKKWNGIVCPKIQGRIKVFKEEAASCIATWAGGEELQINCMYGDQYTVDIGMGTYSCGKWDVSGIPCPHAVSALFYK